MAEDRGPPHLTIPATINGLPVTRIEANAFSASGLTSITIPASVSSIGKEAFRSSGSLTAITVDPLNSQYSSVGGVLFNKDQTTLIQYPEGLAGSYTIPSSVTSIGEGAFYYCPNLTHVEIPASVTSIGYKVFVDCSLLTVITVDSLSSQYSSVDGVLFNKDQTTLIKYPAGKAESSYTIPAGVSGIGDVAFYSCSNLTSISIPDSVTSIGDEAFFACYGLTNITIPVGVTSIGDDAFALCGFLTAITVDPLNSKYCSEGGVLFNKNQTTLIQYPAGLSSGSYTIPSSVTSIGGWGFGGSGLTSVTIPASVTSIGHEAFAFCGLTSVTIPASVISIGDRASPPFMASAKFMGDAPVMGLRAFNPAGTGFHIEYYHGRAGFTSPTWMGYATVGLPAPTIVVEQPAGSGLVDGDLRDFGIIAMGTSANKVLTLRNIGDLDLTGLTVTMDGANHSDFSVVQPTATTLAPGASTTFEVTFTPSANGPRAAALHIASNDPSTNPFTIILTGIVVAGPTVVTIEPASEITSTAAIMKGSVNPNGLLTTAQFEYGLSTAYGYTASVTLSPDNGLSEQIVSASINDLQPGATYHYRIIANNSLGMSPGVDMTFTTLAGSPIVTWLIDNGLSYNSDMKSDPNGDGVNLLMAYALNLDPKQNLSDSMPKPILAANQMSLTFYAGREGVTYAVESSTDLKNWSTDGVSLSPLDAVSKERTATFTTPGPLRFMRLVVAVP